MIYRNRAWILTAGFALILCLPCTPAAASLATLTPEKVAERVTVHDDRRSSEVVFTTKKIHKVRKGLELVVSDDTYLRAFVNKRSGAVNRDLILSVPTMERWSST